MKLPELPRKEDGSVNVAECAEIAFVATCDAGRWTGENVVMPTLRGIDAAGRWTAERVIVPATNGMIKLLASLALGGVDLTRTKLLEKPPLKGTDGVESVRQAYAGLEQGVRDMSPSAKIHSLRAVYMLSALLAIYAIVPDRDTDDSANRPEITDVRRDDGGNRRDVERGRRTPPPIINENMSSTEVIPEVENLSVMSVYQYDNDTRGDESQSGMASFYETVDKFLHEMTGPENTTTDISSFILYKDNGRGRLVPMPLRASGNEILGGSDVLGTNSYRGGRRFHRSVLHGIAGYKVVENGITYMGVRPQASNEDLNRFIRQITGGEEDVAMLHTRGHLTFGRDLNIPSDVLDPVIVNLGGCRAGTSVRTAASNHRGKALIAREVGTNWAENHEIARDVMELLQAYRAAGSQPTWGQFSNDLRARSSFLAQQAVLPGDRI